MSWWTAEAERTLTEEIPAPRDVVRDFYVDLDNIRLVHPLIVSVKPLSRSEVEDGYEQSYRVVDQMKLGPIGFTIAYQARLHVPREGAVRTEAIQSPGVRLRGTVTFEEIDGGTRLMEHLQIEAPRPLAGFTTREAVKAHRAMLSRIRDHFAPGGGPQS